MKTDNLIITGARIITPLGFKARKGKEMNELYDDVGTIEITEGKITYVGADRPSLPDGYKVIHAKGKVVLPGFVDSHTHLVFGGFRPDEFIWRLNGDTYMSILQRGGGILSTVKATQETSAKLLRNKAEWFINTMSRMGVTTVEGKADMDSTAIRNSSNWR